MRKLPEMQNEYADAWRLKPEHSRYKKGASMKRDFELIRKILIEAEGFSPGASGFNVNFPGEYSDSLVNEHAEILIDAGLLDGRVLRGSAGLAGVVIFKLTWAGHDFLEASRDDTIWAKAKKLIVEKGGGITFDLLLAWLKKEGAERLGVSL